MDGSVLVDEVTEFLGRAKRRPRSTFDFSGPHTQMLYRFRCMESSVPGVSRRLDGALFHE